MNFDLLQKSAVSFAATIATTFNLSFTPVPTDPSIQYPQVIESYNLVETNQQPETVQDLNIITQPEDIKLAMVTKEPEEAPSQDVMFHTVIQPTPKPTSKPTDEKELTIIKEVQADVAVEEKKEEIISGPSSIPSPFPSTIQESNSEVLFQMVNDHRAKLGLPAFEKDEKLCKIAQERAPQVNTELASGTLHKGFEALNLPYWATENIAAYSNIEENLKFWLSDYIHKKAIESSNKYSCISCAGSSCSQIFTSFIEK